MTISFFVDQYRTSESPGYYSITRGSETSLWTRVLGFISGHLATTDFDCKVRFWYVPIENDICFWSVPQSIFLRAPLGGGGPRSPEVIFGPHHWFLNEILLASGILSHSIDSSGPHTTLQVFLMIFSERNSSALFRNDGFIRQRPVPKLWGAGICLNHSGLRSGSMHACTRLHMRAHGNKGFQLQGMVLIYSYRKRHSLSIVATFDLVACTVRRWGPKKPWGDFRLSPSVFEWNPISECDSFCIRWALAGFILHCKCFRWYFPMEIHPLVPEMTDTSVPD